MIATDRPLTDLVSDPLLEEEREMRQQDALVKCLCTTGLFFMLIVLAALVLLGSILFH